MPSHSNIPCGYKTHWVCSSDKSLCTLILSKPSEVWKWYLSDLAPLAESITSNEKWGSNSEFDPHFSGSLSPWTASVGGIELGFFGFLRSSQLPLPKSGGQTLSLTPTFRSMWCLRFRGLKTVKSSFQENGEGRVQVVLGEGSEVLRSTKGKPFIGVFCDVVLRSLFSHFSLRSHTNLKNMKHHGHETEMNRKSRKSKLMLLLYHKDRIPKAHEITLGGLFVEQYQKGNKPGWWNCWALPCVPSCQRVRMMGLMSLGGAGDIRHCENTNYDEKHWLPASNPNHYTITTPAQHLAITITLKVEFVNQNLVLFVNEKNPNWTELEPFHFMVS